MELNKEYAKELQKDFIPGGGTVDIKNWTFRKTLNNEVYRCAVRIGYDPQSGPIYCGNVAEYVAFKETGIVAICENHSKYVDNDSLIKLTSKD